MKRKMTEGAPEDGVIVHESGFLRAEIEGEQGHALVLLNSPLPTVSLALWRRAAVVVCADGGANWVYDDLPALAVASGDYDGEAAAREALLPRYLIGDLDSVRPEVRAFYAARGTVVIDLSADQDSTDFMKALDLIQGELRPNGGALVPISAPIVALCGSGAERPDHDLGNMSTLFERAHRRIALVGRHCVTRCLPAGRNALRLTEAEGPQCGLIPMAGPARATTKVGHSMVGSRRVFAAVHGECVNA